VVSRKYRNRRIGDFLKDLHLTEGRGSGIPLIYRALEKNGSPSPEFVTDEDKSYFLSILKSHPEFKNDRANDRANVLVSIQDINDLDDVQADRYNRRMYH